MTATRKRKPITGFDKQVSAILFQDRQEPRVQPGDSGAPAALKAIEAHELRCREDKEAAYVAWKESQRTLVEDDDVSMRKMNRCHREYIDALEIWDEATKKLGEYDKRISPERREGEKASVADVKEWFAQLRLSIDLAIEDYIVQISQKAALVTSPEEFHRAHADALRAAKDGAIDASIREEKLPKWVAE